MTKQNIALHKAQLCSLLIKISDNNKLAKNAYFKGGTCASMLGFLDCFSVDLDFDLNPEAKNNKQEVLIFLGDEIKRLKKTSFLFDKFF